MQKARAGAVLSDTTVKVAQKVEVEERAKSVECNRLFSDSHEKSRKPEQYEFFCTEHAKSY
jgi:hypothetical protein